MDVQWAHLYAKAHGFPGTGKHGQPLSSPPPLECVVHLWCGEGHWYSGGSASCCGPPVVASGGLPLLFDIYKYGFISLPWLTVLPTWDSSFSLFCSLVPSTRMGLKCRQLQVGPAGGHGENVLGPLFSYHTYVLAPPLYFFFTMTSYHLSWNLEVCVRSPNAACYWFMWNLMLYYEWILETITWAWPCKPVIYCTPRGCWDLLVHTELLSYPTAKTINLTKGVWCWYRQRLHGL